MIQKLKCVIVDDDSRSNEMLTGYCQELPYVEIAKRFMKVLVIIIVFVAFGGKVEAQNLTYHAIAMDTNSVLFQNHKVSLRISIMQGNISNLIYSETFTATSDSMGVANFTFGNGTVVSGSLPSVNWSATNLTKIEIDPNAGSNYYEIGIAPLKAVNNVLIPNQK